MFDWDEDLIPLIQSIVFKAGLSVCVVIECRCYRVIEGQYDFRTKLSFYDHKIDMQMSVMTSLMRKIHQHAVSFYFHQERYSAMKISDIFCIISDSGVSSKSRKQFKALETNDRIPHSPYCIFSFSCIF